MSREAPTGAFFLKFFLLLLAGIEMFFYLWGINQNKGTMNYTKTQERMVKQIARAKKDGVSMYKLPMAVQKFWCYHKKDIEATLSTINK
jgi:hypothetical protein